MSEPMQNQTVRLRTQEEMDMKLQQGIPLRTGKNRQKIGMNNARLKTIRFRGKDNLGWHYGSLIRFDDGKNTPRCSIHECTHGDYWYGHFDTVDVDMASVGQFTGLCDAEHKDIYEGDVLKTEKGNLLVEWYDGAFRLVTKKEKEDLDSGVHPYMDDYNYPVLLIDVLLSEPVEVLGNIYDNPELLK